MIARTMFRDESRLEDTGGFRTRQKAVAMARIEEFVEATKRPVNSR
jgi:hypothetical protein